MVPLINRSFLGGLWASPSQETSGHVGQCQSPCKFHRNASETHARYDPQQIKLHHMFRKKCFYAVVTEVLRTTPRKPTHRDIETSKELQGKPRRMNGLCAFCHRGAHQENRGNHSHHLRKQPQPCHAPSSLDWSGLRLQMVGNYQWLGLVVLKLTNSLRNLWF